MPLFNAVEAFCRELGFERTYWVAYSGGVDSHVLLHLLVNLRSIYPSMQLRAVYVNHGLSPRASDWAAHCARVCKALQVDYIEKTITATASTGESPEEVARARRYAVLSTLLAPNDLLLTAHHRDDQAETVLLQLFRGAGPKGLAAMPRIKPFGDSFLARPLLDFTRADLKTYAEQNQLVWIEDESNANIDFSRNFVRHQILPMIKQRWPTISATLARVSSHCADAQQLLDEVAAQDLAASQGAVVDTLSVARLLTIDSIRQRQVLRLWLRRLGFPLPSMVKIQQIQKDMLLARSDKAPHISWKGGSLRRYQDDLYVMSHAHQHDVTQILPWHLPAALRLPGVGVLHATPTVGQGLRANLEHVSIRFRRGGEVCRLPGRDCHHRLKHLFQEWRISPWERDRIPLVYVKEDLAAVVGLFVGHDFIAQEGQEGYLISLEKSKCV